MKLFQNGNLKKKHFVKKSTISAYSLLLQNHIIPFFGKYDNISEDLVQEFVLTKISDGLSQKTVKDILIIIKMIMKYGAKKDLIISNWNYRREKLAEEFNTEDHPVECWELSNRSIPILLFNLSIRGIVGEVYHGNVLKKEIKAKYTLLKNNQFSKITKL